MSAENTAEAERLCAIVLGSLDEERTGGELAREAFRSRSHFYRLFRALLRESPAAMRRRLLLERAAWQLGHTTRPVTDIALDADYASLEAFTRAFRRAFRASPSLYRRMGVTRTRLPAPGGFHYGAPCARVTGASDMDLFDRFAGAESWHTRRLLEQAAALDDSQLDQPLNGTVALFGWHTADRTLREMLERIVVTTEVWAAALTGGAMPKLEDAPDGSGPRSLAAERTLAALRARFEKADAAFTRALAAVRDRGAWDDTFVDALCEPPEAFTFGGTFAHVVTFNAFRRLTALDALRRLGAPVDGFGCPMEYEAAVAPWRAADHAKSGR